MLSGEGNENGEKTTIGLNSKEVTLHVQQSFCIFLCRFFARLQSEIFQKLPDYTFYGGNVVRVVLFTFVFTAALFYLPHFLTAATKFPKNVSFFLSLALALCRSFSR